MTSKHLGISFDSETSIGKISFRENSYFTHRGLRWSSNLVNIIILASRRQIKTQFTTNLNISNEVTNNRASNKLLSNFPELVISQAAWQKAYVVY